MTPAVTLLRRAGVPLALATLAGGITAAVVTARSNPGVEVVQGFTVPVPSVAAGIRERTSAPTDLAFDALQSADLFAGTLTGWLASPDFVSVSYRRAGLRFPGGETVRRLSRAFAAQKRGGSIVEVRFRARTTEEAQVLARAVAEELQERVRTLNAATSSVVFQVQSGGPLIVPVSPSPLIRGLVAAFVVGFVGVNLVLLWDYLRTA